MVVSVLFFIICNDIVTIPKQQYGFSPIFEETNGNKWGLCPKAGKIYQYRNNLTVPTAAMKMWQISD